MTEANNQIIGCVNAPVVQVGYVDHLSVGIQAQEALAGLSAEASTFVGREDQLVGLATLLDPRAVGGPIVVSGMPGVGKTMLAVRAGHDALRCSWFPGGVLFANLRGYADTPTDPRSTLAMFLRALGLPGELIPVSQEELETRYRSMLAERASKHGAVLVLLDNASSAKHIRPLLPGATEHKVLVTSRHLLNGLDGVQSVSLDVFDSHESEMLLIKESSMGVRPRHDLEKVREVAALCGHHPLALHIVAALLSDDPTLPMSQPAEALRDESNRLAELEYGDDLAVRATFELSYARLSTSERRLFRLLSLTSGPQFDVQTAAAMAGLGDAEVNRVLKSLLRAHMIQSAEYRDWYCFHDLLWLYAKQKSKEEEPHRDQTIDRMLSFHLYTVQWAVGQLHSTDREALQATDDRRVATSWLEVARFGLIEDVELAHRTGRQMLAIRLAMGIGQLLSCSRRWEDALHVLLLALRSAQEIGNHAIEAPIRCDIARTLAFLDRTDEALPHLTEALQISRGIGHQVLEEIVLREIGSTLGRQGKSDVALVSLGAALDIATQTGSLEGQGSVLSYIGSALDSVGDVDRALDYYLRSLRIFREIGSLSNVASMEHVLGDFYADRRRRFDMALDHYARALWLYNEIDDDHSTVDVLFKMGSAYRQAENPWQDLWRWGQAIWCLETALMVAENIGYDDMVEELRARLPVTGQVMRKSRDDPE